MKKKIMLALFVMAAALPLSAKANWVGAWYGMQTGNSIPVGLASAVAPMKPNIVQAIKAANPGISDDMANAAADQLISTFDFDLDLTFYETGVTFGGISDSGFYYRVNPYALIGVKANGVPTASFQAIGQTFPIQNNTYYSFENTAKGLDPSETTKVLPGISMMLGYGVHLNPEGFGLVVAAGPMVDVSIIDVTQTALGCWAGLGVDAQMIIPLGEKFGITMGANYDWKPLFYGVGIENKVTVKGYSPKLMSFGVNAGFCWR